MWALALDSIINRKTLKAQECPSSICHEAVGTVDLKSIHQQSSTGKSQAHASILKLMPINI